MINQLLGFGFGFGAFPSCSSVSVVACGLRLHFFFFFCHVHFYDPVNTWPGQIECLYILAQSKATKNAVIEFESQIDICSSLSIRVS
jgi:hypothetical protein